MSAFFITPLPFTATTNNNNNSRHAHAALGSRRPRSHGPLSHCRRPRRRAAAFRMDTSSPDGERLVQAAMLGDLPTLQALLSTGVPANHASAQNDSHMTALMWAASEGYVEMARVLLAAGADANATSAQGLTPLLYAFDNLPSANPGPVLPPGFPGQRRDAPDPPQRPVVKRVTGHADVAKLLLVAGADVRVRNAYGETLLHLAARKAQTGWVDFCVASGLQLEEKSKGYEETALHIAAKGNHEEVVRALVAAGADVEAKSCFGWTPLLWAAAVGAEGCVVALLEAGADARVRAGDTTALKEGRKSGKPMSISRLLVRAGAIE